MARFELFIWDQAGKKVPTKALRATREDLEATAAAPVWQTDWTTGYIAENGFEIYALKTKNGELVALGALLIPGRKGGAAPRYLICDEAAVDIFTSFPCVGSLGCPGPRPAKCKEPLLRN